MANSAREGCVAVPLALDPERRDLAQIGTTGMQQRHTRSRAREANLRSTRHYAPLRAFIPVSRRILRLTTELPSPMVCRGGRRDRESVSLQLSIIARAGSRAGELHPFPGFRPGSGASRAIFLQHGVYCPARSIHEQGLKQPLDQVIDSSVLGKRDADAVVS